MVTAVKSGRSPTLELQRRVEVETSGCGEGGLEALFKGIEEQGLNTGAPTTHESSAGNRRGLGSCAERLVGPGV